MEQLIIQIIISFLGKIIKKIREIGFTKKNLYRNENCLSTFNSNNFFFRIATHPDNDNDWPNSTFLTLYCSQFRPCTIIVRKT